MWPGGGLPGRVTSTASKAYEFSSPEATAAPPEHQPRAPMPLLHTLSHAAAINVPIIIGCYQPPEEPTYIQYMYDNTKHKHNCVKANIALLVFITID